MSLCIGLDLDNTIICYDSAFAEAAKKRELVPAEFAGTKQHVADHIRKAHGENGETLWQELQGHVYGAGIHRAALFAGVKDFLNRAKAQGIPVYIVSHKTEHGHFDADKVNLRMAALEFLETQKIFDYLPPENVFFFSTRSEKIGKIAVLGCDVFVDDLQEVFADPAFPTKARKLLFTRTAAEIPGVEICGDWPHIERSIFDAR